MGAVASRLAKIGKLTGKEFNQHPTTKDVNQMSNDLFTFMYSKYNISEMMDIADNPGEYVIAVSDLITAQFNVLGYTTEKNKFGEIYFKKWEKLDPPKTQEELRTIMSGTNVSRKKRLEKLIANSEVTRRSSKQLEHDKHAKMIAFYFVRLFQILGSMLLVVKDTKIPEIYKILQSTANGEAHHRAYAGQAASVIKGFNPPRPRSAQFGGATLYSFPIQKPLGPFEFLRKYLREYNQDYVLEFKEAYGVIIPDPKEGYYKFNYSDNLFLKVTVPNPLPNIIGDKTNIDRGTEQEFCILVKDRNSSIEKKSVKVSVAYFNSIEGRTLSQYKAPAEFDKNKQGDRYPTQVTVNTRANNSDFFASFIPSGRVTSEGYPNGMNYKLTSSGKPNDLYESLNNEYDVNSQFVEILEVYMVKSINRDKSTGAGYSRFIPKKQENATGAKESTATAGPEKNKGLMATYNELIHKDHKPHCIARALDLLDQASIDNEERQKLTGVINICGSSIKGKGTTYKGLKSIGQLFGKLKVKDLLVDGKKFSDAEKILKAFTGEKSESMPLTVDELESIDQADEAAEMSEAIRRLVEAFNINNKLVSDIKSFDDINLDAPSICSRSDINKKEIIKGRPEYIEIQKYAQKLLATHLNNVISITEFLKTIFNITQRPNGSWEVKGPNTDLLFAGYDNLDEITKQARELLVNYYSECETVYQSGVKTWVESLASTSELSGQRVLLEQSAPSGPGNPLARPGGPGNPLARPGGPGGPGNPGNPLARPGAPLARPVTPYSPS